MSLEADKSIESLQFKIFATFAALKDILEFIKRTVTMTRNEEVLKEF